MFGTEKYGYASLRGGVRFKDSLEAPDHELQISTMHETPKDSYFATKFATYNPLLHDHDQDELWVSALVNLLYVPKERLNITWMVGLHLSDTDS